MIKLAFEIGKMAMKRQIARAGRLARTPEAMRRELRAAGSSTPTGDTFCYPKGSRVGDPVFEPSVGTM